LAFEQRKVEESKVLADFNEWLHSADSSDEPFSVVSGFLGQFLPSRKGTIFIYFNSRDVLTATCSGNNGQALPHFQASECWALRRDQSTSDILTSLYNPRQFLAAAAAKLDASAAMVGWGRLFRWMSIISKPATIHTTMMLVIWFCALSDKLMLMFRTHDVPCRYGGEEFAILTSGATNEVAIARCH
jgi:GGDEF domain-containing protein